MAKTTGSRSEAARVGVMGMGAVSAWGWGLAALRSGLRSGQTAIGPFRRFDHSRQRTHVAGEVPPSAEHPRPSHLCFADHFAVFAAREALAHAGVAHVDAASTGVYFSTCTAGLHEAEGAITAQIQGGRSRRRELASQPLNTPGDAVARDLGIVGPVLTISTACASGTLAIEAALRDLRAGVVEMAIAGGADSLCEVTYTGFNALRAVDERPCRPFRANRAGLSLGEGAGVLLLERKAHAERRGARPLVELRGAGSSCDANHMTAPHPEGEGAALAMERALRDAEVVPADVVFVNAHGTGTPLNDAAEWQALRRVFGDRAGTVPLTANKASVGHLLGSAGAVEAVATVLSLMQAELDPTPGDGPVDPALAVDLVVERRGIPSGPALSINLAFGGANAVLVLGPWES
jgi:3-oxoacyl-[acyl-carrier-protein] synthase II